MDKECQECQEIYQTNDQYCHICGSILIIPVSSPMGQQPSAVGDENQMNSFLQTMLDIFGIDLQQELRTHFNETNKQLSQEYITTLGKIEVDPKGTIFYNCVLSIGPLKINGVSSDFSQLPFSELTNLTLLEANPICGETSLVNNSINDNTILYFRRGVVPFAAKALRAQEFGAHALIISQNVDRWPFIMTDSSQSTTSTPITIPVIMISQSDGHLVEKYLATASAAVNISLSCQSLSKECIICQELYQQGDILLKLPCCHLYHQACLFRWLSNAHTCPLCRLELPTETRSSNAITRDSANLTEEQRREQEIQRHRGNYFV